MKLFGKNPDTPVWKNKDGTMSCPGDRCRKKCDETCPIWLNTEAAAAFMKNDMNTAFGLWKKAVDIEPEFYDGWNNLATIHASWGQYEEAYECFKNAEMYNKAGRPNPTYGLVLTTRDLGRYEECLEWCDKYNQRFGENEKVSEARKIASSKLKEQKEPDYYYVKDIHDSMIGNFQEVLDPIYMDKNIKKRAASTIFEVPVFLEKASAFCQGFYSPNEERAYMEKFVFAYYGSMCAALTYFKNNNAFEKDKLFEYLVKACDIENIDAYSDQLLNIRTGSPESDAIWSYMDTFNEHIRYLRYRFKLEGQEVAPALVKIAMEPVCDFGVSIAYMLYEKQAVSSPETNNVAEENLEERKATFDSYLADFHKKTDVFYEKYNIKKVNASDFFDSEEFINEIIENSEKFENDDFFMSLFAFYGSICASVLQKDEEEIPENEILFNYLIKNSDNSFLNITVYAADLLGYSDGDDNMTIIWGLFSRFRRFQEEFLDSLKRNDFGGADNRDGLREALRSLCDPGASIADKHYENIAVMADKSYEPIVESLMESLEDTIETYSGNEVAEPPVLVGRNFYHYTNGARDEKQPAYYSTKYVFDLDEEDEDADNTEAPEASDLAEYIPDSCWLKKICIVNEEGIERYIVAFSVDENNCMDEIRILKEEVVQVGGGMFFVPGMSLGETSYYEDVEEVPYAVIKELDYVTYSGGDCVLFPTFSFIGKPMPKCMIKSGENSFALQSSYRMAYMHMTIYTDDNDLITDFDYSTYQSSGNPYNDMFSRPICIDDCHDEAVDMLIHLAELYGNYHFHEIL